MQITKHKVVGLNYRLDDETGQQIEEFGSNAPLYYLHGEGLLIGHLEDTLEGKEPGSPFELTIQPEQAYGRRDPELVTVVPREALGEGPFQPGQTLQGSIEQVATITKVDQDEITVDANHPLADRTLRVSGSVVDVRDATHEEVALGRAEGQDDATMLILITMREQKEQA